MAEILIDHVSKKFGDFTAKSGRKIPYFINAGEIKTGKEIATCIQSTISHSFITLHQDGLSSLLVL